MATAEAEAAGAEAAGLTTAAGAEPLLSQMDSHSTVSTATAAKTRQYLDILETKLNRDIGFYYWKKYTAAAFWANISMPVNLAITLLTGLTTAQANTSSFIPGEVYSKLTIITLFFTILNTFFRPHAQMTANLESVQKWNMIGLEFEKVYYEDLDDDYTDKAVIERTIEHYMEIQDKINAQRSSEGIGIINFTTDLLHVIAFYTCCRRHQTWIERERQVL